MYNRQHKLGLSLYLIFVLIALVIITDFILPGRILNDNIVNLKKERQQYYNAARNYHYTYSVVTSKDEFLVSKDFAQLELVNEKIEYSISPIFKEVNWYKLLLAQNKSYYSLRIASGLILPLLNVISVIVAFRYPEKIDNIVFILQILLIVDLIFLMK
ncbi:hypothetical protein [Namhaeicola litoreus]|uniref:Uncharacterized protein n=1 Tax=Namhaeicola litoreus TaxID=1052145 RepID=A0ABW3XZ89_9FLAO